MGFSHECAIRLYMDDISVLSFTSTFSFFIVFDMMSHSYRLRTALFHDVLCSADSLLASGRNSQDVNGHVKFYFLGYEVV
jgi:hypothetical protein